MVIKNDYIDLKNTYNKSKQLLNKASSVDLDQLKRVSRKSEIALDRADKLFTDVTKPNPHKTVTPPRGQIIINDIHNNR